MTIPPSFKQAATSVADMVRDMIPRRRGISLSPDERLLAIFLRGNDELLGGLRRLILSRIEGRANLPEPTDPLVCKSMMARDRELQWLMSRLEAVYNAPINESAEDGEQPAA